MTPKEKSKDLFNKFIEFTQDWDELDGYIVNKYNAKKCALIAVDEILPINSNPQAIKYWQEVKQEIDKL